jgi:peptidoglycan/xylan/chitin deacetylase (PgdA/CDA1 family)
MTPLTATVKRGLLATRHYARALRQATFPGVAVLGYHGLRSDDLPPGSMAFENLHLRASVFDAHCAVIRENCDPISLDDWRAAVAGRASLPRRPVLLTFDDGYRSVHHIGGPILARHGVPAVVFVCTDPIERRRLLWFDHMAARDGEEAVESWKARDYDTWADACADASPVADNDPRALMTSAEVAELSRIDGMEVGGHTARHPILARASREQQAEEIGRGLDAIRRWTGRPVCAFAFPNGRPGLDYGPDTLEILRQSGVDMAFTMRPSFARPDESPLERSRFLMLSEVSAPELAHRLAYSWAQ